jgi:hypothetical protein
MVRPFLDWLHSCCSLFVCLSHVLHPDPGCWLMLCPSYCCETHRLMELATMQHSQSSSSAQSCSYGKCSVVSAKLDMHAWVCR